MLRRFGARERDQRALLAAGLIIERERSASHGAAAGSAGNSVGGGEAYYDRFRDRLMFPIRDTRGRVIAFGGRVLGAGEPKYLNSPETALFHKSKELYGLYETRLARRPLKRLLVVEGYMDVVRLHQAGITEAVATLGTATTVEHLRRAFRLVSEVVFCFDGDRAGRAAAWRALQQSLPEAREGRELRFLFLPEGEDPDSLVGREGGEVAEAEPEARRRSQEAGFDQHLVKPVDPEDVLALLAQAVAGAILVASHFDLFGELLHAGVTGVVFVAISYLCLRVSISAPTRESWRERPEEALRIG